MRPGPRLVRLALYLSVFSLLVAVFPLLVWALAVAAVALVAFAAFEARTLRRITIAVERDKKIALFLDEVERIPMRVTVSGSRSVRAELRQTWPGLAEPASSKAAMALRPGESLQLSFDVRGVARGTSNIARAHVAYTCWQLVERITPAGETTQLHVIPNLKAVGRLHNQLNQYILRGLGSRAASRLGKGREFDRLRDYVRGDDFRDIAWKSSARHGKLIVREFRLDRSQDIIVCLDRGHRMAARVGRINRLDHAINAAVLLAYICNRMEDRVGVVSFSARVDRGIRPARGSAHLRQVTSYVTDVEPQYNHSDYLALAADLRHRVSHRSLILLFTALPEYGEHHALLRAIEMLAPQHLVLIVVMKDPDLAAAAQFEPANHKELARTLVARDLADARAMLAREMRSRGALVVDAAPSDVGLDAVNAYLRVKRKQLL